VAHTEALIAESDGRPSGLEPRAKMVLKAAREIHDGALSRPTFAALQAELDNAELMDLVVTATFYCAVVRLLASFEIDVEEGYMPYLRKYPLPA
jgi:hypothetical protein